MTKIFNMLLAAVFALGLALPQAKADAYDQKTIFTFAGPVEIPGKVLSAGTYVFKVADSQSDRDIVQVYNKNGNRLYGTFLTIPDYRMKPTGKPVITFNERPAGSPAAVKVWFYPGDTYGHEFVYPRTKAVALAKANNTPVASMPDEMAADTTLPASTMKEDSVMAMKQAPLKAEEPDEQEVDIAEVFVVAPPEVASGLPKTASEMPLIGLVGLTLLGVAFGLRVATSEVH